jgi:cellulose synthase/poly-beta-1,6-N-acetylglucosamine synthase-like glycosyltransferase
MTLLFAIIGIYSVFILILLFKWMRVPATVARDTSGRCKFSVLVPFRNEADNLPALLESLESVEYPKNSYEIIFIDDHSKDKGPELIMQFMQNNDQVKLLRLANGEGKKAALQLGISKAVYEIIVTTDADCRVPANWLREFDSMYDAGADFCIGAVKFVTSDDSKPQEFQQFEQLAVTGIGAALTLFGCPVMCNGANLSYRREMFEAVNGFEDNIHIPSGDDQFLLQKVRKAGGKVRFINSPDHVVVTNPQPSWPSMVNQRLRWAGKWRATGGWLTALTVLVGCTSLASVLIWAGLAFAPHLWNWVLSVSIIKLLVEYMFAREVAASLEIEVSWKTWPLFAFFYPLYAIYLAVRSNLGQYEWKGRHYSTG